MSTDDRTRWDKQHLGSDNAEPPAVFIREIFESNAWPALRGKALDVACGKGRNALYLAQRGFAVTALDVSAVALEQGRLMARQQGLSVDWRHCDLEEAALDFGSFDLIIDFNYLQRSLIRPIKRCVRPGGHVIFETYLIEQGTLGHPKNPDYLLRHNELLDSFRGFRVLFYREGKFAEGGTEAFRAALFAQRVA